MITINRWNENFEHAESRKRQVLNWFACPVGLQSTGYIALSSIKGGFEAFGVFCALCQLHATNTNKDVRLSGTLSRSDGRPMSEEMVANILRIEIEALEDAITELSSDDVNWITIGKAKKLRKINNLPLVPDHLPLVPDHLPSDTHYNTDSTDNTNKQKKEEAEPEQPENENFVFLSFLIKEVSEAYGAKPERILPEAKRALLTAHQQAPFNDEDVSLAVRFIKKHKAGKFGPNAAHIPQSASKAVERFSELLERAQGMRRELTPPKPKKVMRALPDPNPPTEEELKQIKDAIASFKTQ
jgi:hypothetical protein